MEYYQLQETQNAHIKPLDWDFKTVSQHKTLEEAVRQERLHNKRMHKICGNMSWDHSHRVVYQGVEIDTNAEYCRQDEIEENNRY